LSTSPTAPASAPDTAQVVTTRIAIDAADGRCPAYLCTPAATGRWPAVVFYGDAGGLRPAMVEMAQRLAGAGFAVLLPDPFYRYGPYPTLVPREVFAGDAMAILGPLMATTGNRAAAADVPAFVDWLDRSGTTSGRRLGAVGFCMGGGMAIAAAAALPERFAAVASFHGGQLATDDDASPHRQAARLRAEVYVAAAENDEHCPPDMLECFERALAEAAVEHVCETYTGARHGWMVPDFPVYDAVAAERGWRAMVALFRKNLGA